MPGNASHTRGPRPSARGDDGAAPDGAPSTIGKYRVLRKLGEGGMGVVWEAEDPLMKRRVAIKVLSPAVSRNPDALERFLREAQSAGRVHHPNIVAAFDVGEQDGTFHFVMELVEGTSAADYVRARGAFAWPEATRVVADACRGLAAAHEAGLIHRDIKPANIMRSQGGVVKLADFGLAKAADAIDQALTHTGAIVGTPLYMSPEQCLGEDLDARSDLYSLGATYYTLLTGAVPYQRSGSQQVMFAHCNAPVPDPRTVNPEIPAAVAEVVFRSMAKAREERFGSAAEMLDALGRVLAGKGAAVDVDSDWNGLAAALEQARTSIGRGAPHGTGGIAPTVIRPGPAVASGAPMSGGPAVGRTVVGRGAALRAAGEGRSRLPLVVAGLGGLALLAGAALVVSLGGRAPNPDAGKLAVTKDAPPPHGPDSGEPDPHGGPSDDHRVPPAHVVPPVSDPGSSGPPRTTQVPVLPGPKVDPVPLPNPDPKTAPPAAGHDPVATPGRPVELDLRQLTGAFDDRVTAPGFTGANDWFRSADGGLEYRSDGRPGKIGAPVALRATRYELEVHFERVPSGPALPRLHADLPLGDGRILVLILGGAGQSMVSGASGPRWVNLAPGVRQEVVATVQRGAAGAAPGDAGVDVITFRINGKPAGEWRGRMESVSRALDPHPRFGREPFPSLYCPAGSLRVTTWKLRVEEGSARLLRPSSADAGAAGKSDPVAITAEDEARIARTAAWPARTRVEAVRTWLKERNPGFDNRVAVRFEGETIALFSFNTDTVRDLVPLRGLGEVRQLEAFGSAIGAGRVTDLSPLRGMKIRVLHVGQNAVEDLSPLEGMQLERFVCYYTPVKDLSPLRGMPLREIDCDGTKVSDLSPLRETPIKVVFCAETAVTDLSPLRGKGLTHLSINDTQVHDLSPLADAPLRMLYCLRSKVADLTVVADAPIRDLQCSPATLGGPDRLLKWRPEQLILRGDIRGSILDSKWHAAFAAQTELKSLQLHGLTIHPGLPGSLSKCPVLETLVFSSVNVTPSMMAANFTAPDTLRELRFEKITNATFNAGEIEAMAERHPRCRIVWSGGTVGPKSAGK